MAPSAATDFDVQMAWRPLERPQSASNLRPSSAGFEEEQPPTSTKLRLLTPLHAGIPSSPDSKLRSVVEALFHVHYHSATSSEYDDAAPFAEGAPSIDLNTAEGIRSYLSREPSLAWAAPYAATCLKLLRKRSGANHSQAAKMPVIASRAHGSMKGPGMRRSHSAASRLCGGGRLPPMGGGGALCAASLLSSSPAPIPTWEASSKLAGIEWETAVALADRLTGLASAQEGVAAWLIIEICRDCANHATCFRHEERSFQRRYAQLRAQIAQVFAGPVVELLVPAGDSSSRSARLPIRIGAFEVFLCCPEPLIPFGAISLPTASEEDQGQHTEDDVDEAEYPAKTNFSAVCISSKLRTLKWPQVDATLMRLAAAMPRTHLRVRIQTEAGLPVPNVRLRAAPSQDIFYEEPVDDRDAAKRPGGSRLSVQGQTDLSGCCRLLVPVCLELRLSAWHERLLDTQEQVVVIPSTSVPEEQFFVAETVVQLWQAEDEKELVVYCFSPRAHICSGAKIGGAANAAQHEEWSVRSAFADHPELQPGRRLRPFKGSLETRSGQTLIPDARGYLRGGPQLLDDVEMVVCDGWRSADIPAAEAVEVHDDADDSAAPVRILTEVARLGVPLCEVYIVASCCGAPLPKAHISIDGEPFGTTDASGNPILCGIRKGEHQIQVKHTLVAEGLAIPVSITDSTTRGVNVPMPFRGLHFVCVARKGPDTRTSTPASSRKRSNLHELSPTFRSKGESAPTSADLWLVGGSLAKWKSSHGGPASGQEVWLYNGEFRGIVSKEGRGFVVESGVITGPALDDTDYAAADGACCLSHALGLPVPRGNFQTVLHPSAGPPGCTMCMIAKLVESTTPALWVARMEGEGSGRRASKRQTSQKQRQLSLRTTCCQRGFLGASATLNGKPAEFSDGIIDLPWEGRDTSFQVCLKAIPGCLLPGRSCEYVAHCTQQSPQCMDLDISCSIYVYWVPPDPDEEEDEESWDGNLSEGFIWVAANSDQVPEEALPVEGVLECPGAEEAQITFDGTTLGPFTLCPAQDTVIPTEEDGKPPCLLAGLKFHAKPPAGYYHRHKEPNPLAERCGELGGCELPRLVNCPVAIGFYSVVQPPPLNVKLCTTCCGCAYTGASVMLKGHTSGTIDESGCVELKRRVDKNCSALQVNIDGVPSCLLPGCKREQEVRCGPFEEVSMDLDVSCMVWAYWIPPREEEPVAIEELSEEAAAEEARKAELEGRLFITANLEQVPEEACPIEGVLRCPGSQQTPVVLDGRSIGPFRLDAAPTLASALAAAQKKTISGKPCLLSGLTIEVREMEGLAYEAIEPAPVAKSSGCLLQDLAQGPITMGYFSLMQPPPLKVALHTGCCCRGYGGAQLTLLQKGEAVCEVALDENGCGELQRKRDRNCKELFVQVNGVASCLLPGYKSLHKLKCKPFEEVSMELDVAGLLWVYWLPPDEDEDDADAEAEAPQGLIFVTSDKDQVPDEAKPVMGVLVCRGAECLQVKLDGSSTGPFSIRLPRRVRDVLKRTKADGAVCSPKAAKAEGDADESVMTYPLCLLAGIEYHMKPPDGYTYVVKDPSPLTERNEELGGCELERVAKCPTVVGYFKAIVPPPLNISFCTSCCGRGFVGSSIKMSGGLQKGEATVAEDGQVKLRRRRDPNCKQLELQVDKIPLCLLPGAARQINVECHPFKPIDLSLDIQCLLWVYWTKPDEDEEDAEDADGEPPMPQESLVWVASDVEHVPEEAQCVRGSLMCRGAEPSLYAMSGISVGPFQLKRAPPEDGAEGTATCVLSGLSLDPQPPEGFFYRARDPSPLADRCTELGGCEMQRLTQCPMVVGYYAPIPAQPVQLSLRCSCCGRGFDGANVVMNGDSKPINEHGELEIPRKRDPKTQTEIKFQVNDVPPSLLPGGSSEQTVSGSIFKPLPAHLEAFCNLWVYWVPEEEDMDEEDSQAEIMVWIACDAEHVPDEAMPVAGVIECPGTEVPWIELDGVSKGPFLLRKASMSIEDRAPEDAECILSRLSLTVLPPDGHTYRARDPSPCAERCEELGGCELQRMVKCPTVFGYLKPDR